MPQAKKTPKTAAKTATKKTTVKTVATAKKTTTKSTTAAAKPAASKPAAAKTATTPKPAATTTTSKKTKDPIWKRPILGLNPIALLVILVLVAVVICLLVNRSGQQVVVQKTAPAEVVTKDNPPEANMFGGVSKEYVHERVLKNIEMNKAAGMEGYSVIPQWLGWSTRLKTEGGTANYMVYFPKMVSEAHLDSWKKGETEAHFYVDYKEPTARILTKPDGVVGSWTKIQVADRVDTPQGVRLVPKPGLGLWTGDYHGEVMEYMWALVAPM